MGMTPRATDLYLDLLRRCLTRELFLDEEVHDVNLAEWPDGADSVRPLLKDRSWRLVTIGGDSDERARGGDWPPRAETMIGTMRMDNLRACVTEVLADDVPGDLIEAGVWRGGAAIFMRAILAAYNDTQRSVWVADSFVGMPVPDPERYPADTGIDLSGVATLAVSRQQVEANFERYGLLDEQVKFLPGWFSDTLPGAPIEQLAVIRLDGDLYQSTMDALSSLYPKLSAGGYVIVDDYFAFPACRKAVEDYRAEHSVNEPVESIDWTGVYWRRES
jgi:O-methyltransferase